MREFNFFRPYVVKKTMDKSKLIVITVLGSVFFIGVCFSTFCLISINGMNAEMAKMTKEMNNPENIKQLQNYTKANRNLGALNAYGAIVESVSSIVDEDSKISTSYLEILNETLPAELFIQTTNITRGAVTIAGISKSRTAIAEYEYNLKNTGLFNDVFVANINLEQSTSATANAGGTSSSDNSPSRSGNYLFSLSCKVKGDIVQ